MLIYYICSDDCTKKDFEYIFAKELQRSGFDVWSNTISIGIGSQSIGEKDDYFGDTQLAIVILNDDSLEEPEFVNLVKEAAKYDTIKFVFILCGISKKEFKRETEGILLKEIPNLKDKINRQMVFIKKLGINNLVSEIGTLIMRIRSEKDNEGRISTAIDVLDYLLAGGLIKGSACNIIGPSGSGKTTLGLQLQKAALEKGYGCLYITYSEPPRKLLIRMQELGCDIDKYIANGKFRIYDSYSTLNGLSEEKVKFAVGEKWFPAIIRVEDPTDAETYFNNQIKAIKEVGAGGVNIIDTSNIRFEITQIQKERSNETYKEHFSKFKAMAGETLKSIGVHIVEDDFPENDPNKLEFLKHLTRVEDGNIRLSFDKDCRTGNVTRKIRIEESGQIGCGNSKWYEYVILQNGIRILPLDEDDN